MWVAEKLLSWAYDMTPYSHEGHQIRRHIVNYWMSKVKENK